MFSVLLLLGTSRQGYLYLKLLGVTEARVSLGIVRLWSVMVEMNSPFGPYGLGSG
jgi:hypothetical protein